MYKRFTNFVMPRPMVWVSLCFIIGIVIQSNLKLPPTLLFLVAGILVLLAIFKNNAGGTTTLMLLILAGGFRVVLEEIVPPDHLSAYHVEADSIYTVRAVVDAVGETRRGTPKYLLRPEHIQRQSISAGAMILYAKELTSLLHEGDTLMAGMQINTPRPRRNPHEFDYRDYLAKKDIYFEAFLSDPEGVVIRSRKGSNLLLLMFDLKEGISNHFHTYLTPRSAGILSALILGDK